MKLKNSKTKLMMLPFLFFILMSNDSIAYAESLPKLSLKFNSSGNFKIVQFSDTQDGANPDPRTLSLMNRILDYEKPNLVVLTGDNIDGKCKTEADARKAITSIAQPMESRNIPWAIVFGNHDDEHGMMNKEQMMNFYMSFKNNISQIGYKTEDRIGNYNILIKSSKSNSPAFNIYMLDSGKYAPTWIGGYDWIKPAQVNWYMQTSNDINQKYGNLVPALMFFHIPIQEFIPAYTLGLIDGKKTEAVCCPKINSGMFEAISKVGDVKGIFVGHDHINNYCASLGGIRLGYAGGIGYGTYGSASIPRGGRVFLINESNPTNFKTWLRQEGDLELSK